MQSPSSAPTADDDAPYLAAWLGYRKRWREIWLNTVVGWLVIAALVQILPRLGAETMLSVLFPLWGMIWFTLSAITLARLVGFSCPRCGNTFFNPLKNPMSQMKCQSCGLKKLHVNDHGMPLYRLEHLARKSA